MKTIDQFAAHAMQGLLAIGEYNQYRADEIAHDAYKLAQAMMDERDLRIAERVSNDTRRVS